jgi:PD-(D/E)XK nuclease superfamily
MIVTPDLADVAQLPARDPKEMLAVRTVGNQTEVRINSSSLAIILSCPRKAHYALHRGLKSVAESPALTFGSAIHKALEVFYSHPAHERTIPKGFVEYSDLMAFGKPAPDDHFLYKAIEAFVRKASPLQALPNADKRSIPTGIWLLQEYFKVYINDPYVVFSDESGPVVERTCETVLHETAELKIVLFGTIDVVLRNEANDTILPADHKTASQLGSDFYNRIRPNHQYTGYVLLGNSVLKIPGESFLVNALQVKQKPVTARGSGPNFARQVTTRSAEDIAEFRESVVWAVQNYLEFRESSRWPISHVDACAMYGGCTFLSVCSAPSSLRENLIEAKFVGRA